MASKIKQLYFIFRNYRDWMLLPTSLPPGSLAEQGVNAYTLLAVLCPLYHLTWTLKLASCLIKVKNVPLSPILQIFLFLHFSFVNCLNLERFLLYKRFNSLRSQNNYPYNIQL